MIKKTIVSLLLGLFLFSCTDLNEVTDSLRQINEKQNLIIKKLNAISEVQKNLAVAKKSDSKKTDPKKKDDKPKPDPNKVYDIAEAGSIVLGNPKAPLTIIKWTDFQ